MKQRMKVYTPDQSELMEIRSISREGNNLIVSGKIMGSMPMKAVIRPDEARQGLRMLGWRTCFFLLTFLFRNLGARDRGPKDGRG